MSVNPEGILTAIITMMTVYLIKLVLALDKKVDILGAHIKHLERRLELLERRERFKNGVGRDCEK